MPLVFNPANPEVRAIVDVCGVESIVAPNYNVLESIIYEENHKAIECELYCTSKPSYLDIIIVSPEEPLVNLTVDDNFFAVLHVEKSLPYRWRIGVSVNCQFLTPVNIRIKFPNQIKLIVVDEEFYKMINGGFVKHREIVFKKESER